METVLERAVGEAAPAHDTLELALAEAPISDSAAPEPILPEPAAPEPRRDNLPEPDHPFIGRRAELARCLAALSPDERGWGVIIDGMGGIGKTALALEVARRARALGLFEAYLFVSAKVPWQSAEGVREQTLAASSLDAFVREFLILLGDHDLAGLPDAAGRRAALLASLLARPTLLIWDNLEALIEEERLAIAEFLRTLPGPAKAIVTSRRRMGESAASLRLGRMSAPEADALVDDLCHADRRVAAALAAAGASGRARLYERVDGHPQALRMVLGLLAERGCSLDIALSRLGDPVRSAELYESLYSDAVAGLGASDCAVLSALGTFHTVASPEALADAARLPEAEVELSLERLHALSLVAAIPPGGYQLHGLTRTYVRELLGQPSRIARAAAGRAKLDPQAQRRALRYWVDYASRHGGERADTGAFEQLDLEWPNIEAAAVALRELSGLPGPLKDPYAARMINELARALFDFLRYRSYWDEQLRLGEWAYESACALGGWQSAGWRAYQVAWIHYSRADLERAALWADRMAEATERAGNRRDRAVALRLRGLVAEQRGDLAVAERLFSEALAEYRELGNQANQAMILSDLGSIAQSLKQIERASGYYAQALELAEQLDNHEQQAICTNNLGLLELDRGRPSQARGWYERGLALANRLGRSDLIAYAQHGLARVLELEWRYHDALALAEQALAVQERLHDRDLEATQQLVDRLRRRVGRGAPVSG
jgi:tetratricopeptide (TPR) repeat protein